MFHIRDNSIYVRIIRRVYSEYKLTILFLGKEIVAAVNACQYMLELHLILALYVGVLWHFMLKIVP